MKIIIWKKNNDEIIIIIMKIMKIMKWKKIMIRNNENEK